MIFRIRRWRFHVWHGAGSGSWASFSIVSSMCSRTRRSDSRRYFAASRSTSGSSPLRTAWGAGTAASLHLEPITKWFRRARVEACVTNTPPPGPGRAVSMPRISRRRIASLIVASATPKRPRSSSLVPSRSPGLSSPPVISCSSSRAIASPSEMRDVVRNESVVVVSTIRWPPVGKGRSGGRTYHGGCASTDMIARPIKCNELPWSGPCSARRERRSGGGRLDGARVHRLEDRVLAQVLAGELRADPPAIEDEHAVADGGELVEIGRGEQDDRASRGGAPDEDVHLGLRADVDAARRVVEEQDRRLGVEPLGEHDLLLVAA